MESETVGPRALIVDDDPEVLNVLGEFTAREGFAVSSAPTLKQARRAMTTSAPDILLIDIHLPDGSGLDLLEELGPKDPEIVLITGQASVETAVEALRRGATDYLTKPVDFARLKGVLGTVARSLEMKHEVAALRDDLARTGRFGPLVGACAPMRKVYDLIGRVARTDATVFISGETGTGKEVVAQTIHSLSRRREQPFVPVDCGAISATLVESEMFGHERGSFTGADRQHKGYFERAHGGTLFLDEVTEMPVELQVKLLRAIETRRITRVGGNQPIEVDVRILAATNRRLEDALAAGKLRDDLLYRLNVFPIALPPLRDRGDDVERLAEHFLAELNAEAASRKELTPGGRERLRAHAWPGNLRELRNALERGYILAAAGEGVDPLPEPIVAGADTSGLRMPVGTSIADAERLLILATLDTYAGDKKKAAAVLKISLNTLYSRLNEYKAR